MERRQYLFGIGAAGMGMLGGCTDGSSSDESEDAPSGTEGDETPPTESPLPTSSKYPPGTSASGIDQPDTLINTTQRTLKQNSYDVSYEMIDPTELPEPNNQIKDRYRSSLQDKRYLLTVEVPGQTNHALFFEGGVIYEKSVNNGETTYSAREVDSTFQEIHTSADVVSQLGEPEGLGGILQLGNYKDNGIATFNGQSVRQFNLKSVNGENIDGEIVESSGSVLLAPSGVVYSGMIRTKVRTSDGDKTFQIKFTINKLENVEISRPPWVEEQF